MLSLIITMCLFALSMSISPGPVNLIILSTGVNYGFRNTMPFVSGAVIGFALLLLAVGLGLANFTAQYSTFLLWLGYVGSAFIIYMGIKIATAIPTAIITSAVDNVQDDIKRPSKPGFSQGFLLQWVNPKAWIASLAGVSAFNLAQPDSPLVLFVSLYFFICYGCLTLWAFAGSKIAVFLNEPHQQRIFNYIMGGSLIGVAILLIIMR